MGAVGQPTLAQLGTRQLEALAAIADDLPADLPRFNATFVELLGASAAQPARGLPAYRSDVVDDHTPYEMSITLGGAKPELRLLVEPVGDDTSLAGRWRASRVMGERLRERYGADLSRLDRIADLFEPQREDGLLALWYAVTFHAGAQPEFKAYLDLRARGNEHAAEVLEEALDRLGLAAAYPRLMREAGRRGAVLDELVYFSLDLVSHERARVKVYFRHHQATAADAEQVIGPHGGVEPGEVRAFCAAMLGHEGPYVARPLVSCWAFAGGAEPSGATIYAPVAYYARDDHEVRTRVHRWLDKLGLSASRYDRCLQGFAGRPLDAGVGMHSYVSFKRDRGVPKMTFYLAPEAYQTFPPGSLAQRPMPTRVRAHSPEDLVSWYEHSERIAEHPLFRRLAREKPAIAPVQVILLNNWVGIGDHFPRWLAHLVARISDDRVRSVLAKQLDDELGHGDPDQAHRVLFQKMLADLEPYAPPGDRHALTAPGRRLAEGLARNYLEYPELEAIGGTLIAEIYGKQVDQALGDLLRRQRDLDPASLTWLVLHETLEVEHADESLELARMTPRNRDAMEAVYRGAEQLATLGARYFDDLYEVLFP
ncbi:MAG: iron-containing redox enzyme family protein [Kofleriaceae bacterium]